MLQKFIQKHDEKSLVFVLHSQGSQSWVAHLQKSRSQVMLWNLRLLSFIENLFYGQNWNKPTKVDGFGLKKFCIQTPFLYAVKTMTRKFDEYANDCVIIWWFFYPDENLWACVHLQLASSPEDFQKHIRKAFTASWLRISLMFLICKSLKESENIYYSLFKNKLLIWDLTSSTIGRGS